MPLYAEANSDRIWKRWVHIYLFILISKLYVHGPIVLTCAERDHQGPHTINLEGTKYGLRKPFINTPFCWMGQPSEEDLDPFKD